MIKYLSIKNNHLKLLFFATLIFTLKPLEFIATNISVANSIEDLISPIIFHGIIYLVFLAFFVCGISLKANFFIKFLVFLASAYYLQYYFLDLADLIENLIPFDLAKIIIYLVTLLFISSLSFYITFKFLSSSNKALFFGFILVVYFSQLITLSHNLFNSLDFNQNISNAQSVRIDDKIQFSNNLPEDNVYYLVLDGQTSQKYFDQQSPENSDLLNEYVESLKKNKFKFFENSFSSYNTTYLTLGSIFNMKYYDSDINYKNRDNFFPKLLFSQPYPPLLRQLNEIDYKFYYSGNLWADCKPNELINCIRSEPGNHSSQIKIKITNLLNNPGVWTLIKRSILRKLVEMFLPEVSDGISNFKKSTEHKSLEPASREFYFIHNFAPHPPYVDQNCVVDKTKSIIGWGDFEDYAKTVLCTMSEVVSVVDQILSLDPNAIIVIQGDHGPAMNYDFLSDVEDNSKSNLIERFSIMNAIRLPDRCLKEDIESIGNVETINLILRCISTDGRVESSFITKSFAGFYEDNEKFGSLEDVTERLNN